MTEITMALPQRPAPGNKINSPGIPHGSSPTDESETIRRCKQGDPDAWNLLIARYQTTIYRFALTMAHNRDDADDISGQVFIRIYENIHTFRNGSAFTSWLYSIVRNAYVDTCLRPRHRTDYSLDEGKDINGDVILREVADTAPSPEARYLAKEQKKLFSKLIFQLPGYQREVIVMFHVQNLSYDEIAVRTGMPVGTVKSRLSRAREMLRTRLESYEAICATPARHN